MALGAGGIDPSIPISILSLCVSAIALFLEQLRPPRISIVAGPLIQLYYPSDGGFGVYLPITFLNRAAKTGTVSRCGITLYQRSNPEERFFMEWRYFVSLGRGQGSNLATNLDEAAHALAVPGKSDVPKMIWFSWRAESKPEVHIVEGQYVLLVHYWTRSTRKPKFERHEFHVDAKTQAELDSYRANHKSTIVNLGLDRETGENQVLTSVESQRQLGV